MKNLFAETVKDELLRRIDRLRSDSPAIWGSMNSAQMLAHCVTGARVALGDIRVKRVFIGYLFGAIAKKTAFSGKRFSRNLPTSPYYKVSDEREFENEKIRLRELIIRFYTEGENGCTGSLHPFFGKLSPEEWAVLMYKHTDHHLRQFGV